jgi:hypothetical protein
LQPATAVAKASAKGAGVIQAAVRGFCPKLADSYRTIEANLCLRTRRLSHRLEHPHLCARLLGDEIEKTSHLLLRRAGRLDQCLLDMSLHPRDCLGGHALASAGQAFNLRRSIVREA